MAQTHTTTEKKPFYKQIWFYVSLLLVLIVLFLLWFLWPSEVAYHPIDHEPLEEGEVELGLRLSPSIVHVNDIIPSGSRTQVMEMSVYNDSSEPAEMTFTPGGFLSLNHDLLEVPAKTEAVFPVFIDVPSEVASEEEHQSAIGVVSRAHGTDFAIELETQLSYVAGGDQPIAPVSFVDAESPYSWLWLVILLLVSIMLITALILWKRGKDRKKEARHDNQGPPTDRQHQRIPTIHDA